MTMLYSPTWIWHMNDHIAPFYIRPFYQIYADPSKYSDKCVYILLHIKIEWAFTMIFPPKKFLVFQPTGIYYDNFENSLPVSLKLRATRNFFLLILRSFVKGRHHQFYKIRLYVGRMLTRNNPKRFWICMPHSWVIGANRAKNGSNGVRDLVRAKNRHIPAAHTSIHSRNWLIFFSAFCPNRYIMC